MPDHIDLLQRLVNNFAGMAYRCLHDADWTLSFVSDGSTELLGYTPTELMDGVIAVSDLIHPDDLAHVSLTVERALAIQEPFRCIYRMRTKTGGEKWINELGIGVFDEEGSLLALEGFLTDVSERVAAEDTLRKAQRREAIGKMASGIAHDFNNLLTGMLFSSRALMKGVPTGHPNREDVESLDVLIARATQLTQQLMSLGTQQEPVGGGPIDVGAVIAQRGRLLQELTGKAVALHLEMPEAPLLVRIEQTQLEQILMNLVVNARDAISGQGEITVHLTEDSAKSEACLSISDSGEGINPKIQRSIFDPFFTTKGDKGTGLGLAVVAEVVQGAGGRLELESKLGQGSTFRLFLPLIQSELPISSADALATELLGTEVLLLVDDDALARIEMAKGLRRLGYTVFETSTGAQARHLSDRHKGPLNAIIVSANIPGLSPSDAATQLAKQRPNATRILCGGSQEAADAFHQRLPTPLTADALARALREHFA